MKPQELLGNTEVFSSLPDAHKAQIAERLQRMEVPKGKNLVLQGQPGDALYIIDSGQVGVYVRDTDFGLGIEVAQLGPRDCVGELALITGAPRSATCTATVDTVVYKLDKGIFDVVLKQSPGVQVDMMRVLAKRLGAVSAKQSIPFLSLNRHDPDPKLLAMVPLQLIRKHAVIPVCFEDGVITVAAVNPANKAGIEEIKACLRGIRIKPVAVSREDFDLFSEKMLSVSKLSEQRVCATVPAIRFLTDAEENSGTGISGGEITQIVNQIIHTGIELGASDIHVEPSRNGTLVRYRVHGALENRLGHIPANTHKSLISRFKVLGKLDITETRKPQEGRISLEIGPRSIDLRLSLIPTKLGSKLVMRVLDASSALVPLDKLVLADKVRQAVRKMFYAPHGIVLITGPTGSGKTTTMYSALLERRNPEINIVTVEDPVEFHLDGLSQVEINGTSDLNFATVLRSFLRQDPDIILVGETRDAETAKLALQAGLTGRLVFTSFHTNNCISSVVRLFEMGMEPFALANSLVGVIHQRLVRRICPKCRTPFEYYPQIIDNLRYAGVITDQIPTMYRSKGCESCNGQGYKGRVAAMEILLVTESVRTAIAAQATPGEILKAATPAGAFVPISRYLGFLLQHGITVPGEVLGVLPRRSQ